MEISKQSTDEAVLREFGLRVAARRVDLELTQADLAEQAGIAKRTLERMEAGHSSQLTSVIRVLRVLDALPALDTLLPEAGPRPMDFVKRQGRRRQRASGKRRKASSEATPQKPWTWDDDS